VWVGFPVEGHHRTSRTAKPPSRSSGKIFLACGVEVCLNLPTEGMMIEVFEGNRGEVGSVTEDRGSDGLTSAGTDPLRSATGRVKIHRLGGPLRGFVQQALKLARRVDV
jgi:hypothetical protein